MENTSSDNILDLFLSAEGRSRGQFQGLQFSHDQLQLLPSRAPWRLVLKPMVTTVDPQFWETPNTPWYS